MARWRTGERRTRFRSIRRQLVAIAWIPSLILLLVGVLAAGFLAYQGQQTRDYGADRQRLSASLTDGLIAVERERLLTLRALADPGADRSDLTAARERSTAVVNEILADWATVLESAPADVQRFGEDFQDGGARALLAYREQIDAGSVSTTQADRAYSDLLAEVGRVVDAFGRAAPEPEIVYDQGVAAGTLTLSDTLTRSMALAEVGTRSPGLTEEQYQLYTTLVGTYRGLLAAGATRWEPAQQQAAATLTADPRWRQLQLLEGGLLHAQPRVVDGTPRYLVRLPAAERASWDALTEELPQQLVDQIYVPQSQAVADESRSQGNQQLTFSLAVAAGLLLVGLLTLLLATRSASKLVRRLRSLRDQTLELAEGRLPSIVEAVRRGEPVDIDAELPRPAPATDEIGQVAEAFDSAQRTAVTAATQEAENRAGSQKVFLNIARRSQVIVHRQLRLLDRAERSQEDPDQLMLLFELDHLATRAQRNAENLIILGGAQAGRQWRKPVRLVDLVGSAIGESERYARVTTNRFPDLRIDGTVVADLVHLLAELVDNATSFSPPSTQVEVRGEEVGRGVVVEIEDRGLGIEPPLLDELNGMLHDPPDFSLMALAEEPRLGLFVVARLAAKHGILVTLVESPVYGGTKAVVRIPTALVAPPAAAGGDAPTTPGGLALGRALPPVLPATAEPIGSAEPIVAEVVEPVAELRVVHAPEPEPPSEITADLTPASGVRTVEVGPAEVVDAAPDPTPEPVPDDGPPALPRRVRQTHLVPQLLEPPTWGEPAAWPSDRPAAGRHAGAGETTEPGPEPGPEFGPTPEQTRDRFAGLQRGTRQGRTQEPEAGDE